MSTIDGELRFVTVLAGTEVRHRGTASDEIQTIETGEHPLTALAFGQLHGIPIAAIARADGTVTVRHIRDGLLIGGPLLLPNAAHAITLSADGHLAICFDADITVMHALGDEAEPVLPTSRRMTHARRKHPVSDANQQVLDGATATRGQP
jgi:hypothetical protein